MRKAFVFIAAFAAVLVAGAAFAFMATPGGEAEAAQEVIKESTTTSTFHEEEKKELPFEEEEKKEETKEDPPKEEKDEEAKDIRPPEIVILHPENGTHTTDGEIAYEGEAEPGSRVYVGDKQIDVTDDGHWRVVLGLETGANYRTFVAVDEAGHEGAASVKVWRDEKVEPKEEKKEEPKEHKFTANQKYGSCGEAEPYDKWYGTGEPGTKIWIESDFGGGFTTIGEGGEWSVKVFFNADTTPCNDEFTVILETDKEHRKVYEFIRWCEDGGEGGGEGGHEEPPPEGEK